MAIADPTDIEGCVSEANIVFGINAYKELCGVHLGGITLTSPQLLLRCVNKGAERAKLIVSLIKAAVEKDSAARADGNVPNLTEVIRQTTIASLREKPLAIKLKKFKGSDNAESNDIEMAEDFEDSKVKMIEQSTVVLLPETKPSPWIVDSNSSDENDSDTSDEIQATTEFVQTGQVEPDDSEEDVKMIVESNI